jgi:hypothetical protein
MHQKAIKMGKIDNSDTSVDMDVKALGKVEATDSVATQTPPEDAETPQFNTKRTKALLRKLDWHLVPFLALLYL